MDEIARDSWSAWLQLKQLGGMEPEGRDRDLIAALREELAPGASSFEAAVREVGTEQLVRAVFRRIAPFAEMFADIVEFFRTAGATTGRDHWQVKLDDSILELSHFESFQRRWRQIEGVVTVPVAGVGVMWAVREEVFKGPEREEAALAPKAIFPLTDVDDWFDAYKAGEYRSLPSRLLLAVPAELSELAAIATVMAERLRETFRSRHVIRHAWYDAAGERVFDEVPGDAFAVGSMAQLESDFWLGKLVKGLAWWLDRPGPERTTMADAASRLMVHLPRRQFPIAVASSELEAILKLPVWQRRHELYAVWIGTRIVEALSDRDVEIHHEDGRIVFAFKETIIATVKDVAPPIRLIGERRSTLSSPLGEGRKNGAQPDYGLWSNDAELERCILVVEVKHYAKAARRKFHEVVVDYATAHPFAKVALVNHGPVADMLEGVPDALLSRCRQLGNLTPTNRPQLEALRELVRDAVAETVKARPLAPGTPEEVALVVDVSSSMEPLLRDNLFEKNLRHQLSRFGLMVLADTEIRATCNTETIIDRAREYRGGGTNLVGVVRSVFTGRNAVIVVTDDDGLAQMEILRDEFVVTSDRWSEAGLRVVIAVQSSHGSLTRMFSEALQIELDRRRLARP